jgi:23S rRNA pseudouridine1911/1915/1917 synthase
MPTHHKHSEKKGQQNTPSQRSCQPDRHHPPRVEHTYTYIITDGQKPQRVDAFLTDVVPHATRTKVQRAIDEGLVLLNGALTKASRKVQPGDVLTVRVMRLPPLELVPENIPLSVLYQDEAVLVVDKPAGMVTHPAFGNRYGTLVNAVLWHLGVRESLPVQALSASSLDDDDHLGNDDDKNDGEGDDANDEREEDYENEELGELLAVGFGFSDDDVLRSDSVRPGIVHRLDKDTSGILVVSVQPALHPRLAEQFAQRTAKREYYALVWGYVAQNEGLIEGNIARSPRNRKLFAVVPVGGKYAATEYRVVERFRYCTLLALRLRTGRTHQIRVHCSHVRHPLVGDAQYGGNIVVYGGEQPAFRRMAEHMLAAIPRQALHARLLGFTHPLSGAWMEFTSELPADMTSALEMLRAFEQR